MCSVDDGTPSVTHTRDDLARQRFLAQLTTPSFADARGYSSVGANGDQNEDDDDDGNDDDDFYDDDYVGVAPDQVLRQQHARTAGPHGIAHLAEPSSSPTSRQAPAPAAPATRTGQASRRLVRAPTYDRAHYTYSGAGPQTRSLLHQPDTSLASVSSAGSATDAALDASRHADGVPGPEFDYYVSDSNDDDEAGGNNVDDEEDNDTVDDEAVPPKPVRLARRSSTNYERALAGRRRSSTVEVNHDPGPATDDNHHQQHQHQHQQTQQQNHDRDRDRDRDHDHNQHLLGWFRPVRFSSRGGETGRRFTVFPPSHYLHHGPDTHSQQLSNVETDADASSADDSNRQQQQQQQQEPDPRITSPDPLIRLGKARSFDYNQYRNRFHGLLMTKDEERKPGFSSN
ncbi:hypothetical protein V1514DRAFT_340262 [Lipomyces japonicus]|uniref:uncharacterized protein n=1 Tax=Lipomyces japonicus TaxID=56871 RepID=UPI0034CE3FC0